MMFKGLKSIFKKRPFKNKKIEKQTRLFDESELHDDVSSFLSESSYTIKDVIHINKKVREINKDENNVNELKQFLIDHKNIKNDKKLVELAVYLCKLLKNREIVLKTNLEKSKRFVNFLSENQMQYMEEFCRIYEKIIALENYGERIAILDDYITSNKNAVNESYLLNEMELLLKSDIDLDVLNKMNQLELKMLEIEEKLKDETSKLYNNNQRNNLRKRYNKLQNQTKQLNKELKLVKTA